MIVSNTIPYQYFVSVISIVLLCLVPRYLHGIGEKKNIEKTLDFHPNSDYNTNHPSSDKRGTKMEIPIVLVLAEFNRAHKRLNVLYHNYAKEAGISDAAFWLMYSLYEKGGPCTQPELCEAWFFAPQTINSALKSLEKQGLIALDLAPNSRKNKQFFFTEEGEKLAKEKIAPLVQAEEQSFLRLDEQERNALLTITQKHINVLEEEINRIL